MLAKGLRRKLLLLGTLLAINFVTYKTMWRDHRTGSVDASRMTEVVMTAEGSDLEEKISNVVNETIFFHAGESDEGFKKALFAFNDNYVEIDTFSESIADVVTLEDKIHLAQRFSSSLQYNRKANFIRYAAHSKGGEFVTRGFASVREFAKLSLMDSDELVEYDKVLCLQYAYVFADALHEVNMASDNPEDITIGTMVFVPNRKGHHGDFYNTALSVINSVLFSEYGSSVPHAINIVATKDKFYFIDPQSKTLYNFTKVDVNKEYVKELK